MDGKIQSSKRPELKAEAELPAIELVILSEK